ncbi:S-adenosyl-L-methionine-dependent methyltransferase [Myriangium duriaei CBS 260.36]|uniref:S-adenosyl-L-methionine-dependent methyltransferase n=1 Tax=Myriangium duriaei CBS 260.36 TaxID=1168546 RepID=A0A9P4IXD5_9PEZI|nr:S-adenosyl-L-methionine-dependent methyltransferase [Myriangium duriaei CBS 260.36]
MGKNRGGRKGGEGKRGGGRGGRGGKRGGRGGGRGGGGWNGANNRQSFQEVKKENEHFERFYNELNIVPEGDEREQFWAALRRELPNSFRFCGSKGHALAVQKNLTDRYIPQITSVQFNDSFVEAPQPLPWYPSGLAWQMTTPKQIIRKFAPFAAFQKFLVSETSVGNISRQEAVSMIPPLVLDVKPEHTVLDLCAAPGSKSAQLVEALHAGEEARMRTILSQMRQNGETNGAQSPAAINPAEQEQESEDWSDDGRSTGLLVANDVSYTRAQMLVHQVKRLNSPNLIVMNHDATLFPSIELPQQANGAGKDGKPRGKWLKFDRILADVPCSGDGTCRKNPNIWKDWIPGNALGLYITQVRILVRSLQMLKVGGRVVYSTCSMNPVENEAVISTAIDRCGGLSKVDIIDCSDKLPNLKRNHGLKQWGIMDKEGRIWRSWADVEDAKAEKFQASLERFAQGMFPLEGDLPLDRCIRVYPHQQDTGGFFITVLEKKSEIRARPEGESKKAGTEKTSSAPSVVSIAKELEAKPAEDGVIPKLETAEEYTGTTTDKASINDSGNASAAARQNKEAIEAPLPGTVKRPLEEGDTEANQNKRARVEVDEVATSVLGEPGETEHWPPPPVNQEAYVDIGSKTETSTPAANNDRSDDKPSKRRNGIHEESFKYLSPDHPELDAIFKFYQLPDRFPRDRFMVRNEMGEPAKAIYYTTVLAKEILTKNEGRGMKFVHSGVKMFVKQDAQGSDTCRWRIQTEGLPIIEGWVGEKRVIRLYKKSTLQFLLREMFPKTSAEGLAEIKEQAQEMAMGCSVLRVEPSEGEDGFDERIVLPFWRSMASVNLMLPKEERKAMLLRIYNDDTPLIDHSQQTKKAQAAREPVEDAEMADGVPDETLIDDEDGGVKLNADAVEEDADATAPVGASGVGTEEDALATEDRLRAEQQQIKYDEDVVAAAPEREGESDSFNTTV